MVTRTGVLRVSGSPAGARLLRGLIVSQSLVAMTVGMVLFFAGAFVEAVAGVWGGLICVLAHIWAGLQLWVRPEGSSFESVFRTVVRAETGKLAIVLVLIFITFAKVPEFRQQGAASALLTGFFLVYIAGLGWLAQAAGKTESGSNRNG